MSKLTLAGAIGALALSLPALAHAAVVISPVSAVVETGGVAGEAFGIENIFDQSGLSEGYETGATNFDEFLANDPQHSGSGSSREWFAASGARTARITFDLGSLFQLSSLAFWNEEAGGVGRLRIYALGELIADVSPSDNAGGARFYGADRFDFGPVTTRFVTFELDGCGAGDGVYDGCSIGEVAFGGLSAAPGAVPEPATWATMLLGFFGLGAALRRTRKLRVAAAV